MSKGDSPQGVRMAAREVVDWRSRIRERLTDTAPVHDRDQWLVPGRTLEQSQAFLGQFPKNPVAAAVLVPLIERGTELTVLLTQRATQLKNHAGQISFPGGRIEPSDASPRAAALREAHEEIGLDPAFVTVAGYLPDHVIISGFLVTPVIAFVRPGFELLLDSEEVQSTFEVPVDYLFDTGNHRTRRRPVGKSGIELEVLDIPFGEHNIWGATAGMILTLYRFCMEGSVDG
jgi:8-oxo-dGTP pyrophosphatase MutT (NUDIX family)